MLTGSGELVRTHLLLQADQIAWLDKQAKSAALGRSGVARMLLRQLQRSNDDDKQPERKRKAV